MLVHNSAAHGYHPRASDHWPRSVGASSDCTSESKCRHWSCFFSPRRKDLPVRDREASRAHRAWRSRVCRVTRHAPHSSFGTLPSQTDMLLLALSHLTALATAFTHSFTPRDEPPTLEFNVSVALASLPRTGWAAMYGAANRIAANDTARNLTITHNATDSSTLSLLAINRSASLNISSAVGSVYVFGSLGNSSATQSRTLRFSRNGTDVPNRVSSSTGLIGLADGEWEDGPLTVHADMPTVIRRIEVTTRMATNASVPGRSGADSQTEHDSCQHDGLAAARWRQLALSVPIRGRRCGGELAPNERVRS